MSKVLLSNLSNDKLKERYLMLKNANNYYSKQELMKLTDYLVKNNLTEVVLC